MPRLVLPAVFVFVFLFILASSADAGRLYARRPGTASPIYNLEQTEVRTRTTIRNLLAITHVDETFHNNTGSDLEGFYVFALPEGATVDGLWMWLDGKRYTFVVKRKEEAQQIYDSLQQHNIGDPVILESMGANRFQIRITPIRPDDDRRIELRYFQVLPVTADGTVRYDYPMNMSGYQGNGVRVLDLGVHLAMDAPLAFLETNFDDKPMMLGQTPHSDRVVDLHLAAENVVLEEDFTVRFRLLGWVDSLFVLGRVDPADPDSGTCLVWFPDTIDTATYTKVDFAFMVDASGSMTGLRKDMMRYALQRVLVRLLPTDRFCLVLFNDHIRRFPADTGMAFATPANVLAAMMYLDQQYRPRGITNYQVALEQLVTMAFRAEAHRRCVFVTDGLPNAGAVSAADLLPNLQRGNRMTAFFPLTIYTERIQALSDLAAQSGGRLTALEQGMDVDDALERLSFDFSSSTVLEAMLDWPQGLTDVFPVRPLVEALPYRMTGAARYAAPPAGGILQGPLTYSYSLPDIGVRVERTRMLTLDSDSTEPVQIARYWAALRIRQLLDRLQDVTDSTEIREAVIRLSEKYMILTPFTAFIIWKEPDDPGGGLAAGALSLPEEPRLEQNYPNPFNPTTAIRCYLPHRRGAGGASLRIYDLLGRLVRTLAERIDVPGWHTLSWDGRDETGRALPSGTYLCVLAFGGGQRIITMTLLK